MHELEHTYINSLCGEQVLKKLLSKSVHIKYTLKSQDTAG